MYRTRLGCDHKMTRVLVKLLLAIKNIFFFPPICYTFFSTVSQKNNNHGHHLLTPSELFVICTSLCVHCQVNDLSIDVFVMEFPLIMWHKIKKIITGTIGGLSSKHMSNNIE